MACSDPHSVRMPPSLAARVRPPLDALRQVVANPGLLRLELGSLAFTAADLMYVVGLAVLAYEAGGTPAVALLAIIRSLPSVVLVPWLLAATDAIPRDRLLRLVVWGRVGFLLVAEAATSRNPTLPHTTSRNRWSRAMASVAPSSVGTSTTVGTARMIDTSATAAVPPDWYARTDRPTRYVQSAADHASEPSSSRSSPGFAGPESERMRRAGAGDGRRDWADGNRMASGANDHRRHPHRPVQPFRAFGVG